MTDSLFLGDEALTQDATHAEMANAVRFLAIDAVEKARSGHPGMPMGMADVAAVLFSRFLKFHASSPNWPDRDRFVLSAGHGSMLLYALFYLTGTGGLELEDLKNFRQWGSKTPGHPEYGHTPGVETTTGPLAQGLATAVGMAIGERIANARYGAGLVDHFTYAIAGDGCLMEGLSHEAISLAGRLRLSRLIVLFDDNAISIDGPVSLACDDDQLQRFAACGWSVRRIDGHDPDAIAEAIEAERKTDRPSLIACKTTIGYGAPNKHGSEKAHGAPLGADEVVATRKALDWPYSPFEVPPRILDAWRAIGQRGGAERKDWMARFDKRDSATRNAFRAAQLGELPTGYAIAVQELRRKFATEEPKLATRQASQLALEAIAPALPTLIGGSADLTHSNLTKSKTQKSIAPGDYSGAYLHYGVREHAMAAAMNGLTLYGGFIPYGGTFLAFADYSRPAIRLAALMKLRVIHVMTHDSIGLGEDGPTHQPVEHLAALRVIPNLLVFRPADSIETLEAWDCAIRNRERPSILCLSRQALPAFRNDHVGMNKVSLGAYIVREPDRARDVTIIATGSEFALALDASDRLASEGVAAAVVSAPCLELFAEQPRSYQDAVLGPAPRVAVEAMVEGLWPRWLGAASAFVGMKGFGASAPGDVLYREFGVTVDAVADAARRLARKAA
ncbi:MAG: transketolase [Roseiarcus sp.]